jgi:tetratricopeptide (TPR) repeat protein
MSSQDQISPDLKTSKDLIRQRKFFEASELLQKMHEHDPRDEDVLELLGMACFMGGHLEDAQEAFETLTRLNPGHKKAWVNLGVVLNRMGDHKKAVEVFRRAIQKDRRCAEAYYNMGISQRAMDMNTMAISAYKEAIKIKPDMVEAHLNLGNIYLELKNNGLAIQCFQAALKANPNSKKAQASLEKANSNQKALRKEASPFGRLVDVDSLEHQQAETGPRDLSVHLRTEERELVQKITKSVRTNSRELVPILAEPLRDLLMRIQRLILQPDNRLSAGEQLDAYSEMLNQIQRLRNQIVEDLGEIRAHLNQQK